MDAAAVVAAVASGGQRSHGSVELSRMLLMERY